VLAPAASPELTDVRERGEGQQTSVSWAFRHLPLPHIPLILRITSRPSSSLLLFFLSVSLFIFLHVIFNIPFFVMLFLLLLVLMPFFFLFLLSDFKLYW
jgi:predicted membrane protein